VRHAGHGTLCSNATTFEEMPVPRPRAAMRKIREVLRLNLTESLSPRQIGIAVGLPRTTVRRYRERGIAAGLRWPLPAELDHHDLEVRLFGRPAPASALVRRPVPDWAEVHRELRRHGVTLQLLWSEYREALCRWLRVHLVHRAVPDLRRQARCRPAPGSPGGREALSRLRRRHDPDRRSGDRCDRASPALRGGLRCVELHVRGSLPQPGPAGLDGGPRPRLRVPGRDTGDPRTETTSKPPSPGPTATSPSRTRPTPSSPPTMAARSFRPDRTNRATRPRSRRVSSSPSEPY
jgi:hypothetical protein